MDSTAGETLYDHSVHNHMPQIALEKKIINGQADNAFIYLMLLYQYCRPKQCSNVYPIMEEIYHSI